MTYPTLEKAQEIWQEGLDYRCATTIYKYREEYIFHTQGVASAAKKIAEQAKDLDPEKAYILGLLHDYGKKYDERYDAVFHGRSGYEDLLKMGYSTSARICLTHTFPQREFKNENYTSYRLQDLDWAHEKLSNIVYDDYDRLIQLCDMFFEKMNMVDFETRFKGIAKRYNLAPELLEVLRSDSKMLKDYFEQKIGKEIYQLLNIKVL